MDHEKTPVLISVPQFGGWDQPGAANYTVMFTQARESKRYQKTTITEIKHKSFDNEGVSPNSHHPHVSHHHRHFRSHDHGRTYSHDESLVVGKKRILTYINCCIRPTIATT